MTTMESTSIQQYLKLLYNLSEEGKKAGTAAIANRLGISLPSVTEMLKKLAENGYITYEPYGSASLTDKGRKAAEKITRKHRLLEVFLYDILKIGKSKVHKEACELEHALSDEVENALSKVLHNPESCPDDRKPIPKSSTHADKRVNLTELRTVQEKKLSRDEEIEPLDNLCIGQKGVIVFIGGGRKAVQRLLDMGLTPGTPVKVVNTAPFKGPLEISVRDSNLVIGRGLARKVFLERK